MSSLVQRQSERQGIFKFVTLSYMRGPGRANSALPSPRPIFRLNSKLTIYNNQTFCYYKIREDKCN